MSHVTFCPYLSIQCLVCVCFSLCLNSLLLESDYPRACDTLFPKFVSDPTLLNNIPICYRHSGPGSELSRRLRSSKLPAAAATWL